MLLYLTKLSDKACFYDLNNLIHYFQVQQSTEISEWHVHRFSNGRGCQDRNVVGRGGEQKIKMETRKHQTSSQLSSTYYGNAQITCQSPRMVRVPAQLEQPHLPPKLEPR